MKNARKFYGKLHKEMEMGIFVIKDGDGLAVSIKGESLPLAIVLRDAFRQEENLHEVLKATIIAYASAEGKLDELIDDINLVREDK